MKPSSRSLLTLCFVTGSLAMGCQESTSTRLPSDGGHGTAADVVIHTSITRDLAVDTFPANKIHRQANFTLTNLDNASGTATLGCSAANGVTCTGYPDGQVWNLTPHQSVAFALFFSTGAANPNGVIRASADLGGLDSTKIVIQ